MNNQLNFTEEMKDMMRTWKNKMLHSYIENSNDSYITAVRLHIDNKDFDIENNYVLYMEPDGEKVEFTCFSCVEAINQPIQPSVVGEKNKKIVIQEKIENIYIIREIEIDKYLDGETSEFSYEVACVIQTECKFYVFWRHLIFNTIRISVCEDMNGAVESIKELNEENEEIEGVRIIKERIIERL